MAEGKTTSEDGVCDVVHHFDRRLDGTIRQMRDGRFRLHLTRDGRRPTGYGTYETREEGERELRVLLEEERERPRIGRTPDGRYRIRVGPERLNYRRITYATYDTREEADAELANMRRARRFFAEFESTPGAARKHRIGMRICSTGIDEMLALRPEASHFRMARHVIYALHELLANIDGRGEGADEVLRRLTTARNAIASLPRLVRDAYERVDEKLAERRKESFLDEVKNARKFYSGTDSATSDEVFWAEDVIGYLTDENDPTFDVVPPAKAAAFFRDATRRRPPSPAGGAGNKGTWLVLAKLTLASGALMAPRSEMPTSEQLRREQARLRRHAAVGLEDGDDEDAADDRRGLTLSAAGCDGS